MHSTVTLRLGLMRAALVLASFFTTSTLLLVLGALFDDASRQPWLRDTPQARAAVATCHAHAARDGAVHPNPSSQACAPRYRADQDRPG